jgi:hypothetical protein
LIELLEAGEEDEVIDESDTTITFCFYEANYGCYEQRNGAAAEGIPFVGYHGIGGEYGSYAFAAVDGVMDEMPTDYDGELYVCVNEIGTIDDEHLKLVRDFIEHRKRAIKALEAK